MGIRGRLRDTPGLNYASILNHGIETESQVGVMTGSDALQIPSPPPSPPVPLCQLRAGDRGRMTGSELTCDDCELLRAMGLTEGCVFRVCRSGEPCIVEVEETRLGLSTAVSQRIYVSVESRGGLTSATT